MWRWPITSASEVGRNCSASGLPMVLVYAGLGYNICMAKTSPKSDSNQLPFIVTHKALSITVVAAIIFAVSGVAWWKNVYNAPHRVFQGMLQANLTTKGVTRSTISEDTSSTIQKTEQLSFVPSMASRTVAVIKQGADDNKTHVISETIGTRDADYSRYVKIETNQQGAEGKPLDYSSVLDTWGKSEAPQAYSQSVLGLIPFAPLQPNDLTEVLKAFEDKKAYDVDYSKVEPKRLNGKSALVFTVKINTGAYVEVLKMIAQKTGFNDFGGLNPEDYQDNAPITVMLTIDKMSRQLLEADYVDSGQKETYSSYGLVTPITIPEKTEPIEALQQKIQEIQ